uniref:Uncharacterized protein n=1 Tax=Romanomermis culicivorax TaxID=13658 RepID=A0A915I8L0_ROMCU
MFDRLMQTLIAIQFSADINELNDEPEERRPVVHLQNWHGSQCCGCSTHTWNNCCDYKLKNTL